MNELTISTVEAEAARRGIILTAEDYAVAQQAMDARRAQLDAEQAVTNARARTWAERFNEAFPRVLRALHGIGDVSITFVQTILVGPGVGLILLFLLIVEGQRVYYGLTLFETHPALAGFGAMALVLLNLALELLIHFVEHRTKWIEPPQYRASLALWARRIAYWLGRGEWTPAQKSPAQRFKGVLRVVTVTILALALAGSMQTVLARSGGAWNEALVQIVTQSTLLDLFTWAGGLLFAFAAVISAQALSRYAGAKAVEIAAILSSGAPDRAAEALEAVGASGAAALMARLKEKGTLRRQAAAAPAVALEALAEETIPAVPARPETPSVPPATAKALAWLLAHPDQSGSIRELSDASGFSRTTIQRAKALLKERAQ